MDAAGAESPEVSCTPDEATEMRDDDLQPPMVVVNGNCPRPRLAHGDHTYEVLGLVCGLTFREAGAAVEGVWRGPRQRVRVEEDGVERDETLEDIKTFDGMDLHDNLLRGVYAYDFEKPSVIQQHVIKPMILGRSIIAQAESWCTDKISAFSIGILQMVDLTVDGCQSTVLVPTKEHAYNVVTMLMRIGDFMQVKAHRLVGGDRVRDDIRTLRSGVHVVVGTPGQIYDMINRRALRLDHLRICVLDEVDEMLSRGFKDEIYAAFKFLEELSPEHVQYISRRNFSRPPCLLTSSR